MQLEYPSVIMNIDEIAQIYEAEEKVGNQFDEAIQDVDRDIYIEDATETGIARREKILNITPQDTDTIEERRFRVKTKWNDTYPYTYIDLLQRLDTLLGKGTYTIVVLPDTMEMKCILELKAEKMYNAFVSMIEGIVPLNIKLTLGIRYTQHKELRKFTHQELKKFTHAQIKNRKVLGE